MPLNFIPPQLFLPQNSVKLGRFITNIDHPHQNYHDPSANQTPGTLTSPLEALSGYTCKENSAGFSSVLSNSLSPALSEQLEARVKIKGQRVNTYVLDNPEEWFNQAMAALGTQTWIERQIDNDNRIFMIVGFSTITNARITHVIGRGPSTSGQVEIPDISTAVAGLPIPFIESIEPSVGGDCNRSQNMQTCFTAPGEYICALQYRKVQHKWLSRKRLEALQLSKPPRWISVESSRGGEDNENEDEEDIIEVETVEASEEDINIQLAMIYMPEDEELLVGKQEDWTLLSDRERTRALSQ
ncbi:uncharacterized protein B0J16DRAFT_348285 [Fusarium flagelliforme]|uniref:uncharacterized protein n=1 Tax=Fusarium flagelliforme TaxID=2675880 RepID=UPI001E8E3D02|nr:uncharacterized protein B0J16DRAFT_348285 [Fusarium flagelliforme]KAH7174205.1 hypothetical protein B0J16DRAFT_348285 [Fusarium flagelliforme]